MRTGEPKPVSKRVGDKFIGATLNTSRAVVMPSKRVGLTTFLAQVMLMFALGHRSRAPMQRLADPVAGISACGVVAAVLLTCFAWGLFGPESG
jgi:Cu+-exporting ATPase